MGCMPQPKDKDLLNGMQKQHPYICCLQETHLKARDTYRLKVKSWKKIFHANRDQKKAGVAILISDKIDTGYSLSDLQVESFQEKLAIAYGTGEK